MANRRNWHTLKGLDSMRSQLETKIEQIQQKRVQKKRRQTKYLALALVALLCTTYVLILPAIAQNSKAYCGYEEHSHGDTCYAYEMVEQHNLICQLEESEEHTHGEECYETLQVQGEAVLTCTFEEHEHVLECFSNPDADVETEADWNATFSHVSLNGDWSADLVAIAETQLGYKESEENFIVLEDGETKLGYTRYGQWYGMPYGEWSSMFTAFCLNYAGVDGVSFDQDCYSWFSASKNDGTYKDKTDYTPKAGDLVFLDKDNDQKSDAVGIIREYLDENPVVIKVIEGDVDNRVNESTYEVQSDVVIGYVELPQNPNPGESVVEDDYVDNTEATTYAGNDPSQGDKYHSANYLYYKPSSHSLKMGGNSSSAVTFLLAPADQYTNNWKPNQKEWSATNPGNYVVAYCSDSQTYSSTSGENYMTYTLDKSRFTDPIQKRTLDGIVKHAYPFLTADEMKTQLANAYAKGEIKVDIRDCKESEFIVAAQWAIWDTTNVTGSFDSVSISGSIPNWDKTWNNLTKNQIGHSYNDNSKHVKAIRDWLVKQITPEDLAVSDYDAEVTRSSAGLYNLDVTVRLNRAVTEDENVDVKIVAGNKESRTIRLETGATSFNVNVDDLTEKQILDAEADIQIDSQGIQVYYYDSENYQDLVGGLWGHTYADLSFNLADETIDVSVKKVWSPQITSDKPVQVQLYADGKAYGDKVTLNQRNNWTYTWTDLPKLNALYEDVTYTIKEDPVPGYISSVATKSGSSDKVQVWQQVDQFEAGGTYLLRSRSGFLEQHSFKNEEKLTWSVIDLADVSSTPKESMWTASKNGSGFNLNNNDNKNYYLSTSTDWNRNVKFLPSSSKVSIYYDGEHIYSKNYNQNYYFTYINTDGDGQTTTDANSAASFDLFKLTEVDMPNSDVSFVLTNTEISEVTSVDVTKKWEGKRDKAYPLTVEITLLQNGEPYGNPVELNEDNNWTYKWVDLPAKAGDETFEYTVEEKPVGGFEQSITSSKDDAGQHFVVTNTWIPEYVPMLLSKVDFDDPSTLLAGAVFELYGTALDNEPVATISSIDGDLGTLEQVITVGEDGTIVINNLVVGESYYLVETKAPEGYNLLEEPIKFVIKKEDGENVVKIEQAQQWANVIATDDGLAISVENERGYSLPETGGPGDDMFKIVGAILLIVTALLYLKRRSVKL